MKINKKLRKRQLPKTSKIAISNIKKRHLPKISKIVEFQMKVFPNRKDYFDKLIINNVALAHARKSVLYNIWIVGRCRANFSPSSARSHSSQFFLHDDGEIAWGPTFTGHTFSTQYCCSTTTQKVGAWKGSLQIYGNYGVPTTFRLLIIPDLAIILCHLSGRWLSSNPKKNSMLNILSWPTFIAWLFWERKAF